MNTEEATLTPPGGEDRIAGHSFLHKKRLWTYGGLTFLLLLVVVALKLLFPPVPEEKLTSADTPLIPSPPAVVREEGKAVVPESKDVVTPDRTEAVHAGVSKGVSPSATIPQQEVPSAPPAVAGEPLSHPQIPAAKPQTSGVSEKTTRKVLELSTFNRGVEALENGDFLEAVLNFNRTLSINPLHVRAYNNLGLALMEMGEGEAAEEAFRKGIVIEPDSVRCLNNLALLYIKRGEPERAVPFLEKIVANHPEDAAAWTNLGVAEGRAGKPDAAENAYRRALQLTPQDYRIHFNLARTLEAQGRGIEAIYSYRAFLRLLPPGESDRGRKVISHLQKLRESLTGVPARE